MSIKLAKLPVILASCLIFAPICLAQPQDPTKGKEPIATIAGQAIYEDDLLPLVQSQLMPLRKQEYQLKKQALENLVNQKLLEAEAKNKGISADKLLEQSEEHTSELQSRLHLVCRLLLEKKKKKKQT